MNTIKNEIYNTKDRINRVEQNNKLNVLDKKIILTALYDKLDQLHSNFIETTLKSKPPKNVKIYFSFISTRR